MGGPRARLGLGVRDRVEVDQLLYSPPHFLSTHAKLRLTHKPWCRSFYMIQGIYINYTAFSIHNTL